METRELKDRKPLELKFKMLCEKVAVDAKFNCKYHPILACRGLGKCNKMISEDVCVESSATCPIYNAFMDFTGPDQYKIIPEVSITSVLIKELTVLVGNIRNEIFSRNIKKLPVKQLIKSHNELRDKLIFTILSTWEI